MTKTCMQKEKEERETIVKFTTKKRTIVNI